MNPIMTLMAKHRIAVLTGLSVLTGLAIASSPIPAGIAQTGMPSGDCPGRHHMGGPRGLNLTEAQREQMDAIRASTHEQIDAVLTDEQRAIVAAARADRERHRGHFEALNLTDEQQAQIDAIHRSAQDQMSAILTPEQLEQWQQRPGHGRGPGQGF